MSENVHTIGSDGFTKGQPFVVTERDCTLRWSCGKPGERFRCYLCGHKFAPGDVARWQFTNDTPDAGGNPMVCQKCDGPPEAVVAKWKALIADFKSDRFWSFRRSENE